MLNTSVEPLIVSTSPRETLFNVWQLLFYKGREKRAHPSKMSGRSKAGGWVVNNVDDRGRGGVGHETERRFGVRGVRIAMYFVFRVFLLVIWSGRPWTRGREGCPKIQCLLGCLWWMTPNCLQLGKIKKNLNCSCRTMNNEKIVKIKKKHSKIMFTIILNLVIYQSYRAL